jgi:hypothetical protein
MNLNRIAEILTLSRDLADVALGDNRQQEAAAVVLLLRMIRTGIRAYQEHTGQPVDLDLIKVEAPV